jgi:hypothetical protein
MSTTKGKRTGSEDRSVRSWRGAAHRNGKHSSPSELTSRGRGRSLRRRGPASACVAQPAARWAAGSTHHTRRSFAVCNTQTEPTHEKILKVLPQYHARSWEDGSGGASRADAEPGAPRLRKQQEWRRGREADQGGSSPAMEVHQRDAHASLDKLIERPHTQSPWLVSQRSRRSRTA